MWLGVGLCVIQINCISADLDVFDVCSLYPSAMYFMDGFLKGLPQALNNTSYGFLKRQDVCLIMINIIKLDKYLDFPLTSEINGGGVRDFINKVGNWIICIDKAGLEDLITFHEAEFEIIDGCYFDSGRSNKINDIIKNLYDLRLHLKSDKNPAQVVIKLLMDSMHGGTIIKPAEIDTTIKYSRGDFEKCISINYNYIDSVLEVNVRYYMEKSNKLCLILILFIGVEISPMSKRIMNKVFSCADDRSIEIYDQDTDIIHLN